MGLMLHILCGIPGSGKSTLSRQLAEQHNAILHCYDDIPGAHSPSKQEGVHQAMYERIVQDLRDGKEVVCDDLHTTKDMRQKLLDALCGVECVKVLHVMQTPLDVCIERNRNRHPGRLPDFVVTGCHSRYEAPSLSEGWDEIIYH